MLNLSFCVPTSLKQSLVVQEYLPVVHRLQLSLLQRPVFLVNSRLGIFTAALFLEHPFSRSYGVILPSSLTIVRSLALGFSPHLPVLVCGTGTLDLLSGFSWQRELLDFST